MPHHIFGELSRRRVFRGAAIYVVIAWAAVRLIEATSEPYDAVRRLSVLLAVGLFPLAIAFSWAFRVTPGMVEREDHGAEPPPRTKVGRGLDLAAVGGVLLVVILELALRFAAGR